MSLTSFSFILLFAVSIPVYYCVPRKIQWMSLLACSLVFFVFASGWITVPYLLFGILVAYLGALAIDRSQSVAVRKRLVTVTVLLLAAELFLLKDFGFITDSARHLSRLFQTDISVSGPSLIAPLGMSFYTLSIIGYVIDVYREEYPAQKNLFRFALFACYYPQMVSGPITRYGSMRDALFEPHPFDLKAVSFGLERMVWGYFKKLVVADRIAVVVQTVYGNLPAYPGGAIVFAAVCYAVQLYADFSGCMDIILGASECYGVVLPENFNAPYYSQNISEFWRRWHITLGLWFKDYFMYPLLKSRPFQRFGKACKRKLSRRMAKDLPTFLGLCVIWFCIGIWHGGTYKYIFVSGALPCLFLISSQVLQPVFTKLKQLLRVRTDCFSYRLFGRIRTFALMLLVWHWVCSPSISAGFSALQTVFLHFDVAGTIFSILGGLGLTLKQLVVVAGCFLIILFVDSFQLRNLDIRELLDRQNLPFRWLILFSLLFLVFSCAYLEGGIFIYAYF